MSSDGVKQGWLEIQGDKIVGVAGNKAERNTNKSIEVLIRESSPKPMSQEHMRGILEWSTVPANALIAGEKSSP